ncbi:MAG: BTAD domain-containing putative transcriptional regulator [Actinomycetota bacterium]|jgi:DNA-binding SARP family transcriptional activator|nr:BTAD domain-containing putative transcriptional regulator [Actinomycetota bacterium]
MARLGALVKGLMALVALGALVLGVPWALWHLVGWPLPHHVPSATEVGHALSRHGIPAHALIDALAIVVWVTWAVLVASVTAEIPAAVFGRRARRLPLTGVFQPAVGRLVATVVLAGLTLAPRPGHSPPSGSPGGGLGALGRPVAAVALTTTTSALHHPAPPRRPPGADTSATGAAIPGTPVTRSIPAPRRTYTVRRGDTLWGIAQRELGDPLRWSEIYALNEGRPQPGGAMLADPHWIDPGWSLLLPVPTPAAPGAPLPPAPAPTDPLPAPSRPAPAATAPRTASNAEGAASAGGALSLPSGGVVAGSFAAGVLSAVAAGRLRRRRAYRPAAPRPGLRLATPGVPGGLGDLLVATRHAHPEDERDFSDPLAPAPAPLRVVPDEEVVARPDLIEVAHRDGKSVVLGLGDWPGLSLSGPGAEAALRAWLAALVTRDGPYAAEVALPTGFAERLLPGVELAGVRRFDDTEAVLTHLEAAALGRTRRLEDAEVPDAAAYRRRSPEDPFPLLLALADQIPPEDAPRWSALVSSASRLGLGVVVLAPGEEGKEGARVGDARVVAGANGTVERAAPDALGELLAGASLFVLDAPSAAVLLAPVAAVHDDRQPDRPAQPARGELDGFERDQREPGGAEPAAPAPLSNGATPATGSPAPGPGAEVAVSRPAPRAEATGEGAPIALRVLGPPGVCAFGEEIRSGLRSSAYELLAWYALHPGGASAEAAIDAIWPEVDGRRGRERFWTALGNLRSRLHGPAKNGPEILTRAGDLYRLDPAVLDVDLWRFEAALEDASRAADPAAVAGGLERAVAAYGGDFCPGLDALWVEGVREDLHRRALDALVRLAECYTGDQPERALGVLERAVEVDPICEDLYRRLLTVLVRLGRAETARRTWRLLEGRLAELDLDPEPATEALARDLLPSPPTTIRHLPPRR